LRNHADCLASIDFFVLPTATFRLLFVLIVLHHERRRIVHFGVTAHPTAAWVALQITEAPRCIAPPSDRPAGFFAGARSRSSGSRARVAAQPRPTGSRPVALSIIRAPTVTSDR
jgi:hypothetical protein